MAQPNRRRGAVLAASAAAALAFAFAATHAAVAADRTAFLQPEQIRVVQRTLVDWGYPVALTGSWDDATRAAVGSFQSSNQLPVTGTLDPATSEALGVDPTAVTPVSGRLPARTDQRRDPAVDCGINNTVDCLPGE